MTGQAIAESGPALNQHWVFNMQSRNLLNTRAYISQLL